MVTTFDLRPLYYAHQSPIWMDLPDLTYLALEGKGDPQYSAAYRLAIEALYTFYATAQGADTPVTDPDFSALPL